MKYSLQGSRYRQLYVWLALAVLVLLLVGCGGTTSTQTKKPTPTPSPTPGVGQQMLTNAGQRINGANTLHGIFNLTINGQAFNGTIDTEMWNVKPDKNKTVVLKSTVEQVTTGEVSVTNGKQVWQYNPAKNVVYTGQVNTTGNAGTTGSMRGQDQLILTLVQSVFTRSKATLVSSSARINGYAADDIRVVPLGKGNSIGGGSFNYDGDVYLDKATQLPLQVNLNIQGIGQTVLDIPRLDLNTSIPDSTFTFTPPAGAKVLPLQQANPTPGTGSLTLVQAEQQAGYHLLSIPASQTDYELEGVNALGAPGSQIFTLSYIKGNTNFTIAEGKALANLPASGQKVSLRGTTASLSNANGVSTLAWTENGVGIRITGPLSTDQMESIAKMLG